MYISLSMNIHVRLIKKNALVHTSFMCDTTFFHRLSFAPFHLKMRANNILNSYNAEYTQKYINTMKKNEGNCARGRVSKSNFEYLTQRSTIHAQFCCWSHSEGVSFSEWDTSQILNNKIRMQCNILINICHSFFIHYLIYWISVGNSLCLYMELFMSSQMNRLTVKYLNLKQLLYGIYS